MKKRPIPLRLPTRTPATPGESGRAPRAPRAVARLAAASAAAFGAADLGRAVGLWHDAGKYDPEFQRYLIEAEAGERARGTGPTHKALGASLAFAACEPISFVCAGHHGGLMDRADLVDHLRKWCERATDEETRRFIPATCSRQRVT